MSKRDNSHLNIVEDWVRPIKCPICPQEFPVCNYTWNDNNVKMHLKSCQNKMNRPKKAKIDKKSSIGSPTIKKAIKMIAI